MTATTPADRRDAMDTMTPGELRVMVARMAGSAPEHFDLAWEAVLEQRGDSCSDLDRFRATGELEDRLEVAERERDYLADRAVALAASVAAERDELRDGRTTAHE